MHTSLSKPSHRAFLGTRQSLQKPRLASLRAITPMLLLHSSLHLPIQPMARGWQRAQGSKCGFKGCPRLVLAGFRDSSGARGQFPLFLLAVPTGFAGDPEHLMWARAGCRACERISSAGLRLGFSLPGGGYALPGEQSCKGGQHRVCCGTLASDRGCSSAHLTAVGCS